MLCLHPFPFYLLTRSHISLFWFWILSYYRDGFWSCLVCFWIMGEFDSVCVLAWWTLSTYSSTALIRYIASVLYLSISIICHFMLLLHYISGWYIVEFTPLHLFDICSYELLLLWKMDEYYNDLINQIPLLLVILHAK